MKNFYYIFDPETRKIRTTEDIYEWSKAFKHEGRQIGRTKVGDILISTVFLGLDHSFGGKKPILFETMIFGGNHDQYQERYETYEEAMKGHLEAVAIAKT